MIDDKLVEDSVQNYWEKIGLLVLTSLRKRAISEDFLTKPSNVILSYDNDINGTSSCEYMSLPKEQADLILSSVP